MDLLRQHPLRERFFRENTEYERLKEQALKHVVRWEYARSPLWHWNPASVVKAAARAAARPANESTFTHACGYDLHDRTVVLVEKEPGGVTSSSCPSDSARVIVVGETDDAAVSEHFISYEDTSGDLIRAVVPDGRGTRFVGGKISATFDFKTHDGRIVSSREFDWDEVLTEQTCEWAEGRLASVRKTVNLSPCVEITFDEQGRRTGEFRLDARGARLPAPLKGGALQGLVTRLRSGLVKAVAEAIRHCGIAEPVYCVLLVYDGEGGGVLPPLLAFGVESQRQNWLAGGRKPDPYYLWNPAEFSHYLQPHTELNCSGIAEDCERFSSLLEERENDAPARKLLNEAAAELARLDWSASIKTTPDFIVVAVDLELGDLAKNLKKSVPQELLARLREQKYV